MSSRLDSHGGTSQAARTPSVAPAAPAAATFETLPPIAFDASGWITGLGTSKEPAGISFGTGWKMGHPIGILNHFTDGCGDPHDTLVSRGVSAHGCTMQDGTLVQYVSLKNLSWHAYDQAYYTVGWENAASPGVACEFNGHQLSRIAQLNAAVIAWTKQTYGFDIPIVRSPGWQYVPGLKCHTDGLAPGSPWDPNGHWDAPWRATGDPISQWISSGERAALDRSPWSAADFVAAVNFYATGGDDMTAEEKAALTKAAASAQRFEDFNDGMQLVLDGKPLPADHTNAMASGFQKMTAAVNRPKASAAAYVKHDHTTDSGTPV